MGGWRVERGGRLGWELREEADDEWQAGGGWGQASMSTGKRAPGGPGCYTHPQSQKGRSKNEHVLSRYLAPA